jgi:hypothetical protein
MKRPCSRDGAKTFANAAAIMALPKGTPKPKPENALLFFSFEEAGENFTQPAGLPEWVAKVIMESAEYKARAARAPKAAPAPAATARPAAQAAEQAIAPGDDDVPF